MKREDKKLLLVFTTLVIIIISGFATTIYYIDTKYVPRETKEEGVSLFAKAFADETLGSAPLKVNFSSLLVNLEGTPKYYWDFGDGNTSTEKTPIYNYTKEGQYTCRLTVTDNTGKNVTTTIDILVLANQPPQVIVFVSPTDINRIYIPGMSYLTFSLKQLGDPLFNSFLKTLEPSSPLLNKMGNIGCKAQVFDPEGDRIVNYRWELTQPPITILGNQEWPKFIFEGKNLTTLTFPLLYIYRMGGYTITLTVTDSAGNTASDLKKFGVSRSNFEDRKASLKSKWNTFWNTQYYKLPSSLQNILTKMVWKVLGPTQNFTDNLMEKLYPQLPVQIRSLVQSIYDGFWETREKTYRKPNNSPNEPSNPSPGNNSIGVDLNADLSWNCSDPNGDPLNYDVYFGTTSPPPLVYTGQSGTTFLLGSLQPNTTYYWKIVAKDSPTAGGSISVTGPIWDFTTQ